MSDLIESPVEGETLENYLQRLSDKELLSIRNNSERLHRFSEILKDYFKNRERREDALENIWNIIERSNNLDGLLSSIRRLETVRQELLDSLSRSEEEIQNVYRLSNLGRLVGTTVEVVGSVGGLMMRNSHSDYANVAFNAATVFGMLGFASTLSEMRILYTSTKDLDKKIDYDQKIFEPIRVWYQQSHELDLAMQVLFPFDITSEIIPAFMDAVKTETNSLQLLSKLIKFLVEEDVNKLRDERLMQFIIDVSSNSSYQDIFRWIFIYRPPIVLDTFKIFVQLIRNNPIRFVLSQHIPALPLPDQSITSFPVWARLSGNLLSICDTIAAIRSKEPIFVCEMKKIRKRLHSELVAVRCLAGFIALRRRSLSPDNSNV